MRHRVDGDETVEWGADHLTAINSAPKSRQL